MWKEYYCYGFSSSLAAGNGTVFTDNVVRIDSDADFEFQKTTFFATNGNVRIKYKDDTMGRYLTKTDCDMRAIGSSFIGTPFIWPRGYVILAGTTFTTEAADASGVANAVRMAFHGAKFRADKNPFDRHYKAMVPFVYGTGLQSIAASSTVSLRIEVDRDAHFIVQKIVGFRQGSCILDAKESARDRTWMNQAIHFDDFVGNGQFPHVLQSQRFIYRGSVIVLNVQDLSGVANKVEINMIGVKAYE